MLRLLLLSQCLVVLIAVDVATSCEKNWIPGASPGVCYQFGTSQLTWIAARAKCLSAGGDLLSITSNVEKKFINQKLIDYKDKTKEFWIGLNDKDLSGFFVWSDGSPLKLVNWNKGNPKDIKDRMDCVGMTVPTGYWFDDSCYMKRPYICKRAQKSSVKTPFNSNWRSATDHYWPLQEVVDDEVVGTRTGKAMGNFKTGTAFLNRKHLIFDGSSTYLEINDFEHTCVSTPYKCLHGLTVSFLVKLPSLAKRNEGYILDIAGDSSNDALGWSVYVVGTKLGFLLRSKQRTYHRQLPVSFGKWINIAFTFSMTEGFAIYVDGVQTLVDKDGLVSMFHNDNDEVTTLFVGTPATEDDLKTPFEMMSLAIWERKLSASEIKQVFNAEMRKCGSGWIMIGQYCYQFETKKRTWTEADTYCKSVKAELASVHSGVEQSVISFGVGYAGILSNAWIGLNSKQLDNVYDWSDGSKVSFTHWFGGEPNNKYGERREDCTEVLPIGLWNDASCSEKRAQICKKEKDVLPDAPVDKRGFQRSVMIPENTDGAIACPLGTSIVLKSATYGNESAGCKKDVKSFVEKSCADKQKFFCVVKSSSEIAGDPCPKVGKELKITYSCVPGKSYLEGYTVGCPSGWMRGIGDSCYKLFHEEKSWMAARKACKNAAPRGDLVSIGDGAEHIFMTTLLMDAYNNPDIWIGLNDQASPGEYVWSDNTPVTYTSWYNGHPDSKRRHSCVNMKLKPRNGLVLLWSNDRCNRKHAFMCEVPKEGSTRPAPVTPPVAEGSCAAGWTRVGNKCFKVYIHGATWLDARDNCATSGSKLASITSLKENEAVFKTLMKELGDNAVLDAWIGLTDKGLYRGKFWVDDSPVSYTRFDSMIRNRYPNEKACSVMASNGKWRNKECNLKRPYVCKTDVKKITPSTKQE